MEICSECRKIKGRDPKIPTTHLAYKEVVGFVPVHRAQGGPNAVVLPDPTGVVLCREHMEKRKQGVAPEQQQLA